MTEDTIRRLSLALIAFLLIGATLITAGQGLAGIYERYFNPTPLLRYDYGDRDGLATEKIRYHAGDPVAVAITRCLRVDSTLRNLVYLSEDDSPRGRFLGTLDSFAPAGCTTRTAKVADLPADTLDGNYRIAGAQTVTTAWGSTTVLWHSTAFYVDSVGK